MTSAIHILARTTFAAALVVAAGNAAAAPTGPEAVVTGPADFRHELAHKLQKSESPRDWALGAQLLETRPPTGANLRERLAILQKAAHAAPGDRLVQSLWAGASSGQRCRAHLACGSYEALARLDPDNAVTWAPVAGSAWKSGNHRMADDAIARMAASGRYNEHIGEAIGAWRDVFRRNPPPRGATADPSGQAGYVLSLALDEAEASAIPPTAALVDACSKSKHPDAGDRRFGNCARVGRLMMGRAQTIQGRMAGVAILRASRAGTKADIERIRNVTWQAEQMAKIDATLDNDAVARQNFMNLIQANDSEVAAMQYELTIFGAALTPPADWKQTVGGHPVEPLDDAATP